MVDDERVRANRLALLHDLLNEFSTIADFSEIVTEGKISLIRIVITSVARDLLLDAVGKADSSRQNGRS